MTGDRISSVVAHGWSRLRRPSPVPVTDRFLAAVVGAGAGAGVGAAAGADLRVAFFAVFLTGGAAVLALHRVYALLRRQGRIPPAWQPDAQAEPRWPDEAAIPRHWREWRQHRRVQGPR